MAQITTEASQREGTQQYSHLFSERGEASADAIPIAAMILDSSGTVRYCHADAARLFHAGPSTLLGRHVNELIPDLPFDPRTPGYNLAYATFWAHEDPPHGFCGVDGQGRSFGLQVALGRLELDQHQDILLGLRLRVESAPWPEARNASVDKLAAERVLDEQARVEWVSDAPARAPKPFRTGEELLGDQTIERPA